METFTGKAGKGQPRRASNVTGDRVLRRLASLRPRIEKAEGRLAMLYAQRAETFQAGRAVDPATTEPRATFPAMAEAAGVSKEAIHKALRSARRRDAEQPPTTN